MLLSLDASKLIVKPPVNTNSIKNFDPEVVSEDAKQTHIVVHPRFPQLVERFLEHKRLHGSRFEKELYATPATFSWENEVSRLIDKRPLVFMGASDHTVLRDGKTPSGRMTAEWDRNGGDSQQFNEHLRLEDYLSYDEIMLGSLIGVSSPSYFVNDGDRYNRGRPGKSGSYEPRGIILGLVGARFERPDRMDAVHIVANEGSTHQDTRLSSIFQDFLGAKKDLSTVFDKAMYQARIRITADILFLEADSRAEEAGKSAYAYVVGLGLGVWEYNPNQAACYIRAFASSLSALTLRNISTLEFAWIQVPASIREEITVVAAEKGIRVIFSRRNPAAKLQTEELLVITYAWDGNAFQETNTGKAAYAEVATRLQLR